MTTLEHVVISPADVQYQLAHRYDNDSKSLIVATTICFIIALVSTVLRTIARHIQHTKLGWDDFAIWISMLLATGLWIQCLLLGVRYGAGQHTLIVGLDVVVSNLKIIFSLQLFYILAHFTIKGSILFLYRKIFTLRDKLFARLWWTMTIFVITYSIANFVILLTQCIPVDHSWNPFLIEGSCIEARVVDIATGCLIALSDIGLLVLPWPVLWTLKLPKRTKIGVSALFAIGLLAIICSIARVVYFVKVVSNIDFTYVEVDSIIYSVVEVDIGIICACAPNLRPLFTGTRPRQENSRYYGSGEQSAAIVNRRTPHYNSANTDGALEEEKVDEHHSSNVSLSERHDLER